MRQNSEIGGGSGAPLGDVDVGLLADDVGEAATHTLDGSERINNLLTTINVGVEDTEDVLEVATLGEVVGDERLWK